MRVASATWWFWRLGCRAGRNRDLEAGHRDTADIQAIGLPVFGLEALPGSPQRLDARVVDALASATVGDWAVDRGGPGPGR